MVGRTAPKTDEDHDRLEAIGNMPCLCCEMMGVPQPFPTERNHIVDNGYRKHSGGDQATLPECGWHHRALCRIGFTSTQMHAMYGPSRKWQGGKGAFVERFGTDRERLQTINARFLRE